MDERDRERGRPAGFDPATGEVLGSGSGAGGEGNPGEDYDRDPQAGAGADPIGAPASGHPLPASGEARHGEIPERAERAKGRGDDPARVNQPAGVPVGPDGEPYDIARDQAAHQDRGQGEAAAQAERD